MSTVRYESELMFLSEAVIELRTTRAMLKRWIANGDIDVVVTPEGRTLIPRDALRQMRIHAGPADRRPEARPVRMHT
jgi:predicted site-specific integrase-resolvase